MVVLIQSRAAHVSDVLTSVKVFNRDCCAVWLKCDGRKLDAEICARLGRLTGYAHEYSVRYCAPMRRAGKAITIVG